MTVYLVILLRRDGLYVTTGDVHLVAVVIEIHAGRPVDNGPHHSCLTSILALLGLKKKHQKG